MVNVNLAGKKKATEQEASSEEEVYEDVPSTAAAEIRAGETNTYKYITVKIDLDVCVWPASVHTLKQQSISDLS